MFSSSMLQDSSTDRSESEEPEYPQMPSSPYTKLKEALIQLPKYSVEGKTGNITPHVWEKKT